MATFTIRQTCEAGHVRHTHLVDFGDRLAAELLAATLDGSINREVHERIKALDMKEMRACRCNWPLDAAGAPMPRLTTDDKAAALCDAWTACEVIDGAVGNPAMVAHSLPDGGTMVSADVLVDTKPDGQPVT